LRVPTREMARFEALITAAGTDPTVAWAGEPPVPVTDEPVTQDEAAEAPPSIMQGRGAGPSVVDRMAGTAGVGDEIVALAKRAERAVRGEQVSRWTGLDEFHFRSLLVAHFSTPALVAQARSWLATGQLRVTYRRDLRDGPETVTVVLTTTRTG